jgi:hypothetical protein
LWSGGLRPDRETAEASPTFLSAEFKVDLVERLERGEAPAKVAHKLL